MFNFPEKQVFIGSGASGILFNSERNHEVSPSPSWLQPFLARIRVDTVLLSRREVFLFDPFHLVLTAIPVLWPLCTHLSSSVGLPTTLRRNVIVQML